MTHHKHTTLANKTSVLREATFSYYHYTIIIITTIIIIMSIHIDMYLCL